MNKYMCPYCDSQYQFHKKQSNNIIICGQCGEPLSKKPLITLTQIFALITVTSFITPLILMIFSYIKEINKPKFDINLASTIHQRLIKT